MSDKKSTQSSTHSSCAAKTRRGFVRGTAGALATTALVPTLSGGAAAHFPTQLDIDVQPDNARNFIDVAEHDSVTVAVHPVEFLDGDDERATFDPTAEPVRYRFGSRSTVADGAGARPASNTVRDVEGHGGESHAALVLDFPVGDAGFDGGEETAWLYWGRHYACPYTVSSEMLNPSTGGMKISHRA